jgi:branched-chain amino acid transport system substrate-binding protein
VEQPTCCGSHADCASAAKGNPAMPASMARREWVITMSLLGSGQEASIKWAPSVNAGHLRCGRRAGSDRFACVNRILSSVAAATVVALAVAACGDGDDEAAVKALPSASCENVEYGGEGEPDVLIASDLPAQGASRERTAQQVEAIRLALDERDWRAGEKRVAFQACDDTIQSTGLWDAAKCRSNGRAYAGNPDVVGVIGTYNSGCAKEIIPVANRASGGGLAVISPGNTLVCLTLRSDTCARDEPRKYYPTGKRNYVRVVPNDAFQGAALAQFARQRGFRRVFVLYAKDDPTSLGQATTFRNAARGLGSSLAGFEPWDPKANDYKSLIRRVEESRPDAVLLAGLIEQNGARLIKDKVAVLGPNKGTVGLMAPDGFAQQSTIDKAGEAAAGMFASVPGRAPENLAPRGKQFVAKLGEETKGKPVELYAPYAGEAAVLLLDAIAKAGGNRSGVIDALFDTEVKDGILGKFDFEPSGDPNVGPVTVFVARKTFEPFSEITPAKRLVDAARG